MTAVILNKAVTEPARRSSQAGVAAVEFAFILIVLLLIVAGIIEFGRAMWYFNALTKATRDGARLMSTWDATNLSAGVTAAQGQVITVTSDANVSPALVAANVSVRCDYSAPPVAPAGPTFSFAACISGPPAPAYVRVGIEGFSITLGEWFPFIGPNGVFSYTVAFTPHTTMRYMK